MKTDYRSNQIKTITEEINLVNNSPKKINEGLEIVQIKEENSPISARTNFTKRYDAVRHSFMFKTLEKELIQREKTLSPIKTERSESILKDLRPTLNSKNFVQKQSLGSLASTLRTLSSRKNNKDEYSSFNLERSSRLRRRRPNTSLQKPRKFDTLKFDIMRTDRTCNKNTPPSSPCKTQSPAYHMKLRSYLAEKSISIFSINSFPVYETL